MNILGISGAVSHDSSAALFVDGRLVAAAEEERFIRDKHAKNKLPLNAAQFCLDHAGITADQVDVWPFPMRPLVWTPRPVGILPSGIGMPRIGLLPPCSMAIAAFIATCAI